MPTPVFYTPINRARAILTQAHVIGDGQFVVDNAAIFGSPSTSNPIKVTATVNGVDAHYSITGISSNTLTIGAVLEGTSDIAVPSGLALEIRITAKDIKDLQDAIISGGSVDLTSLTDRVTALETITNVTLSTDTTLTSSAFGKIHVCSWTDAPHTITLPTAVGNGGKTLGFRMSASLTKLATLDGNGSQTIDGSLTRVMHSGETVLLESDGSNWFKFSGKTVPFYCCVRLGNGTGQSIAINGGQILVDHTEPLSDASLADPTNHQIIITRSGNYKINGYITISDSPSAITRVAPYVSVNGTSVAAGEASVYTEGSFQKVFVSEEVASCVAGDIITLNIYTPTAFTAYGDLTGGNTCKVSVEEVNPW